MRRGALLLVAMSGCSYDYDPLYQHTTGDGGTLPITTQALIRAWVNNDPYVTPDCVACAEQKCADAEAACRMDPTCVAYTNCVGANPNPAGQYSCRAQYSDWIRADVRNRDVSGPYGQCVFKYNCAAECGGNDDLSCLNKFSWPSTPAASVPLHLYLADAINPSASVSGITVKACAATDLPCAAPASQGVSDMNGLVELALPTGFSAAFNGYLEISGGTLYPTLLRFSWNIGQETTYLLNTVKSDLFTQSISAVGLMPNPMRGMLQLRALGCDGYGLRGASFSSDREDANSKTWYIDGLLPKLTLNATGTVGSGGIIDLLPDGVASVTATRQSDGTTITTTDAPIRAGFMTVVVLEPSAQ